MNRRAFFGAFGASMAALAIDPEGLLWTPGQKSYHFISRPFVVGDFVYRPSGSQRWGRARSWDAVREGGEFGIYDGLQVQTNGLITAKYEVYNAQYLATESSIWRSR